MHRRDIGSLRLTWSELRIFINHLGRDSAYFRATYPKSHEWDVNTELLAAMFYVLQWANWQRGGGKGERPELIKRPIEASATIRTDITIAERKAAHENEIERRRKARDKRQSKMEAQVG